MWSTALADLRTLLNDNATDKLRDRKRLISGAFNGINVQFKTFEFRRVTDFTTSVWPFGVYKNNSATPEVVTVDNLGTGDFRLTTPPVDGDILEATYYIQYFLDAELNNFLSNASLWLNSSTDFTTAIAPGLQPSALKYAAGDAYEKLSQKFFEHASDTFRTEDNPDEKKGTLVDQFTKMSKNFRDMALKLRDEYYTRQGQSLQPLFGTNKGNVKDVAPQR